MKGIRGFWIDDDLNIYSLSGKKCTPYKGSDGYAMVSHRMTLNKRLHHERVHNIVAEAFVPNPDPENLKYINHIDSDKMNYSPDNLEWCTNSENVYHGWHSGNRTHKNFTNVKVYKKKRNGKKGKLLAKCVSIRQVGNIFNVDRHKVARILKGEITNYYPYIFEYAK